MQVVKTRKYGDFEDVTRFTLYLSLTEYNDLRALLNLVCVPFPSETEEEKFRLKIQDLVHPYQFNRLKNLTSQFNLEL